MRTLHSISFHFKITVAEKGVILKRQTSCGYNLCCVQGHLEACIHIVPWCIVKVEMRGAWESAWILAEQNSVCQVASPCSSIYLFFTKYPFRSQGHVLMVWLLLPWYWYTLLRISDNVVTCYVSIEPCWQYIALLAHIGWFSDCEPTSPHLKSP